MIIPNKALQMVMAYMAWTFYKDST